MKTALLKLGLVAAFISFGAFTSSGLIPDDADGDGVPDSVDACPGQNSSHFDRNGDGCIDAFVGARHIEYWGVEDVSIPYVINAQGAPNITNGTDLTAIQSAVASWTSLPNTNLNFVYGGTSSQANSNGLDRINLVTFVDNAFPFSNLVLAVGLSTSFDTDTTIAGRVYRKGEIYDADMVFNPNKTYKVGGSGPGVDVQSVATHEAGHLFGLSHSAIQSSTMFYVLPGGLAARSLEADDRLTYFKAYGTPAALNGSNRIDGVVTDGQTDDPVPGAIVFLKQGSDTVGCEYTLPDGRFSFPGLANAQYTVWIHPLDGSSEIGFIEPANINAFVDAIAVENFVPEGYDDDESATDNPLVASPITLSSGTPTRSIEIVTNIDAVPPTITQANPSDNTNNVAIDAAYVISFSEQIKVATLTPNFSFREQSTNRLRGGNIGVIEDGRKIVFTPSPPLAFSENYTLTLNTGLTDEFGNALASPFTLHIATEAEPPVGLSSLSPNKGVVGTTIVLTGNGFDTFPFPTVRFGNDVATVTSASPTKLVVTVPANALTSSVTVTNGDAQVSNALTFTVLTAAEVARGFDSGQTRLSAEPLALTVTPDGGYAYIATRNGVEAIVVSPSLPNYLISTPIAYPGGVDAVAATPSGRRVYGISANTRELIEINSDPTTGLLFNTVLSSLNVGATPKGVVVEPSGYRAYVATDANEIQSWDIKLGSATYQQQVNALPTPGGASLQGAMAVTPAGDRLLALTDAGSLIFYSVADESLLTAVPVGADPRDIVIEPTAERAYVMHGDGRISVVNMGGTPFKVQDIQTGGSLRGAAVTPGSRYIYASDRELDNLKIVDLDVASPTFRSVIEDIEAPTNPVDVALTPDGVYALSLLQGDGPQSVDNPSRMLVTTIGAGPALHSIYPQAARIGARVVLSGDSFGNGEDLDVATVDFNGVIATPIVYQSTHITVVVPPGATSGPVRLRVDRSGGGPEIEVSNALAFQVLLPSPLQTNVRESATIENNTPADFEDAIAISPDGNAIFVGTSDGYVIAYDVRPGSPTFHRELDRFQYFTTAIQDLAVTADGKTGYATATGDTHVASFHAVPSDPNFGDLREFTDLDLGFVFDYLKTGPDNRTMLVNAGVNGVRIIGTANHFNDAPMVPLGVIGSTGNVLDMAFHPSGLAAYIAVRNPDALLTVDMDETGMEFGLVQGVYELPGTPAPTPMSIAPYPDGSKLLVQCLQLQGPATRTIFTFNVNNPPYSLSSGPTYTPSGTASHQYQERIRISPKGDVGLRSVADNGFQYFDINSPGTAINTVGLFETFTSNEFEFTPDGNRVYFASSFHDSVRVFDFTPADNLTLASGNNQAGVSGQLLTAPLRIAVGGHINIGEFFQPVVSPGIPVTFRIQSGGGMLRVGDTEADVVVVSSDNQGFAQVLWRLGPGNGTQTVTAQSSNLFGSPMLFTATASPDPNALPLALSELIPLNNSANTSVTTAVLATFSRAVSPGSIGAGSFYLERPGVGPIPTAVGFTDGNRKVSLTPIVSLPYSEQIRVVYTAAIQDAVGGALTTPGNSVFQTQAPPPPHIAAISPPSALTGVPVTISGAGFNASFASNTVSFAGTTATPIAGGTDFLRVVVPASAASGNVSVTVGPLTSNNVPFTVLVPNTSHIDDVIATIGTASGTKSCAVSPDGALCYNVSAGGDIVVPVDVEGQTTFPSIPVGDQPVAIVIDPSGTFAYVANFNSGTVSVIDVSASSPTFNTVVATIPVGSNPTDVAIFPDGDRVIVANAGSSDISVIDGDNTSATYRQVTATIGTASGSKSCAVSGDGARIYVGGDYGFVVLEANSYEVTATIGTSSGTKSVAVSPDGTMLFVLETNGTLLIFDVTPGSASENQVLATIGTGSGTKSVGVSADGTLLYLVQEDSNEVIIVALDVIPGVGVVNPDGATSFTVQTHVVGTLTTGDDPADVAIDPTGSGRVMVANAGDGTLSVFGPAFGPVESDFTLIPGIIIPKLPGFYVLGVLRLPAPLNVHDVDIASVRLFGTVGVTPGRFFFTDANHDGQDELSMLFCRDEFLAAMPENGEHVDVVCTGLAAGDEFEGHDDIRVLRPTITEPEEHERVVGGQPFTFRWTTPLQILPCDQVKIEWRQNGDDADPIDCDFHVDAEEEAGGMAATSEIDELQRLNESAEVASDDWTLIANHVNNDGDYTWNVPFGYFPNARVRITLLWFGFKVGSSEVPFMIEMPVATRLQSFDVTMEDGSAVLRWATSFEAGMEGYQVVRSEQETGRYDAVTKDMVRASGSTSGGSYEYRDESISANRTYWYKLREVADNGLGAEYGPYSVTYRVTNKLDQNVPNPFNPTTVIKYAIASDNAVNLTIYDVAGRKVRTLVNERQRADAYRVTWDGSNDTGQKVASGVYFYKLVAGKFSQTKKMVLLK